MKIKHSSSSSPGGSDVRKEIQNRSLGLVQALQHGRAAETLQFFADNAVLLLPMRAAMVGKTALEDYFRKGEAAGRRSGISFMKRTVKDCGSGYAYETGQYSVNNGGTTTYGHYVTVWRHSSHAGRWLIENQCFNVERLSSDDDDVTASASRPQTAQQTPDNAIPGCPSAQTVQGQTEQHRQPNTVTRRHTDGHSSSALRPTGNGYRSGSGSGVRRFSVQHSSGGQSMGKNGLSSPENQLPPAQRMTSY